MEGHCSTGQSPQWAVVPMEEDEEEGGGGGGGEKSDESRIERDAQRKKYSKMDKSAKDEVVRSPRENGGG